jgi:hypothetical protein
VAVSQARAYSPEEVMEQEEIAFRLFAERKSTHAIVKAMNLSPTTVHKRIAAGIRRQHAPGKAEAVKQDLALLDKIIRRGIEVLEGGNDEMSLKAANVLITALKRRAAMLGYDSPTSILIDGQVELIATVDPRILSAREMLREPNERLPAPPPALP